MLKLTDCTLKSFVVLVHHKPIVRSNFFLMQLTKIFSLIFTSLHISMQLWQFSICFHHLSPGNSGPDGMHTVNALHKLMNRRQLQVVFYLSSRVFASPQTQKRHGGLRLRAHTPGKRVNKLGGGQQTSALFGHWRLTELGPDLRTGTRANGELACSHAFLPSPPRGQRREHISQICRLIPISPAVPDFMWTLWYFGTR